MDLENQNKFFRRNNQKLGLVFIFLNLIMILSLFLFNFWVNPFYFIQAFTIILLFGTGFSFLIFIILLWLTIWYFFNVNFKNINKRRTLMIFGMTMLFIFFLANILIELKLKKENLTNIVSFFDYFNYTFKNYFINLVENIKELNFGSTQIFDIKNVGFLFSIIFWLLGGWFYGILNFLVILILFLYFLYVFLINDYQLFFDKLIFWEKDKDNINVKKDSSFDLNISTGEFELNFTVEEKKKIELIEKVRINMDTKNYEELSKKIQDERQKLINLRATVIEKVRKTNEKNRAKSKLTESQKKEIMKSLGFSLYSKSDESTKKAEVKPVEKKAEIKNIVLDKNNFKEESEEKLGENNKLIQDGYKTTEQAYNIKKQTLADDFLKDVANEMVENYDPTQEIPFLENYYDEIFSNEKELVDEINKTLETKIKLEEQLKKETIIEKLDKDVSVEEYIALPEIIAKTHEFQVSHTTSSTIFQTDETYTSLNENTGELKIDSDSIDKLNNFVKENEKNFCSNYELPDLSILEDQFSDFDENELLQDLKSKAQELNDLFESFSILARVHSFEIGPTITTFKISLESGVKITKIINLEENIKLTLGSEHIRIISPIPGTSFIGIEVSNKFKRIVSLKEIFDNSKDDYKKIEILLGKSSTGKVLSFDLAELPNLLFASSNTSEKSILRNSILASILLKHSPIDLKIMLFDFKMIEFSAFKNMPYLYSEIISNVEKAKKKLRKL